MNMELQHSFGVTIASGRLSLLVAEAVREHSICGKKKKYTVQAFFPELPHKCLFILVTGTSLITDEAS